MGMHLQRIETQRGGSEAVDESCRADRAEVVSDARVKLASWRASAADELAFTRRVAVSGAARASIDPALEIVRLFGCMQVAAAAAAVRLGFGSRRLRW